MEWIHVHEVQCLLFTFAFGQNGPQNWTRGPQNKAMSLQADLSAGYGNIRQTLLPAQVLHEPKKAGMVLVPLEHIHGI